MICGLSPANVSQLPQAETPMGHQRRRKAVHIANPYAGQPSHEDTPCCSSWKVRWEVGMGQGLGEACKEHALKAAVILASPALVMR
mmetsp:Transcript_30825/g.55415  ORF Transcript_30825/g.55415 Transcript_30825/m.55415 type:complete len:86 (-) Transcript_30825:81-338(-)